jgi:2-keto-3-deoxy-L-rhamnonate aldolase RhmA
MAAFEFFTAGLMAVLTEARAEFVLLDTEHSGVGIETIKMQIAASRGLGIVPMVRVPGCHYHLIAPVLDAGAMGIMVPMVETAAQAKQIASWCRYRPDGCVASPSACRTTITAAAMFCKSCARPTSAHSSSP